MSLEGDIGEGVSTFASCFNFPVCGVVERERLRLEEEEDEEEEQFLFLGPEFEEFEVESGFLIFVGVKLFVTELGKDFH